MTKVPSGHSAALQRGTLAQTGGAGPGSELTLHRTQVHRFPVATERTAPHLVLKTNTNVLSYGGGQTNKRVWFLLGSGQGVYRTAFLLKVLGENPHRFQLLVTHVHGPAALRPPFSIFLITSPFPTLLPPSFPDNAPIMTLDGCLSSRC